MIKSLYLKEDFLPHKTAYNCRCQTYFFLTVIIRLIDLILNLNTQIDYYYY